jgi:glycosidase
MSEWWRTAAIYQVYVRSFADANGDGIGDLPGVRSRLPYLRNLGVDGLWLTPFYPSPDADHGYDVSDYTDVDPEFGTLADFDALVEDAHELGLRVVIDVVPNHTSSRASLVPECALRSQPPRPRALRLPPGTRRRPAEQLDVRFPRSRVDARREERRVLPPFLHPATTRPRLDLDTVARYVRPDQLQLAFNFALVHDEWDEQAMPDTIDRTLSVRSRHCAVNVGVREPRRDPPPDALRRRRRGQATRASRGPALLALPGTAFVYEGQELGLEEVDLPDEARRDPIFFRDARRPKGTRRLPRPDPVGVDAAGIRLHDGSAVASEGELMLSSEPLTDDRFLPGSAAWVRAT